MFLFSSRGGGEIFGTLYHNSAGSKQPTITYGGGLEEKSLWRGRCIYVVGATKSFVQLRSCNGGMQCEFLKAMRLLLAEMYE